MAEPQETPRLPIPDFVKAAIFPFEGDLQVKPVRPNHPTDRPRAGEPGGPPCEACPRPDDEYIWVDEHWRVLATEPSGVPIHVDLETRAHVDLDELNDERSAELGQLIVRLERAIKAIGGIGRVHVSRWGDGASHFHMVLWPPGWSVSATGVWPADVGHDAAPTELEIWNANKATVARELARDGGRAISP